MVPISRLCGSWLIAIGLLQLTTACHAQQTIPVANAATQPAKEQPAEGTNAWRRHHCLVIIGLPGDAAHQQEFSDMAADLQRELTARGIDRDNLQILGNGSPQPANTAPTNLPNNDKVAIEQAASAFVARLEPEDSFWLILIGHADHDGEHARFHIPGSDLRAIDYADLFENLKCDQQVFWLTMSSSGWFTEQLSRENRIVITSTTRDAEPNETEFPAAFIEALATPNSEMDRNNDGEADLLELFARTHALVEAAYNADNRAPTEHATLDDDGDGRGTEWKEIFEAQQRIASATSDEGVIVPAAQTSKLDGKLASTLVLPKRRVPKEQAQPTSDAGLQNASDEKQNEANPSVDSADTDAETATDFLIE